jgi:ribosomal protein S18 acetylase RimI-like enzyme
MTSSIISTRNIHPEDKALLYRVFASSREEEYSRCDWPADKIEELMRMQFELQTQGYGSTFPNARNLVIVFDGEPVGRVIINETASEIRMVDIAILTPFRRRGIGRTIVERLKIAATEAGKPLRHRVFRQELNAVRFYFALGYRVIADAEDALQMEWTPASQVESSLRNCDSKESMAS